MKPEHTQFWLCKTELKKIDFKHLLGFSLEGDGSPRPEEESWSATQSAADSVKLDR